MSRPPRVALRLAYLGHGYAGWQRQRTQRTVQGDVERALQHLYGEPVGVIGAGRTDSGVHAAGQVAHFDQPRALPTRGLEVALNKLLPPDVRVLAARLVTRDFHARRDVSFKVYRYRVAWGVPLTPWEAQRRVLIPGPLGVAAMGEAALALVGTHDFASFARTGHTGTGRRGTTRRLRAVRILVRGRRLDMIFEGDGFLRGMARRLAGSLLEVGRGARPVGWVELLLAESGARPPAPTAPAHGLTLERIVYRKEPNRAR